MLDEPVYFRRILILLRSLRPVSHLFLYRAHVVSAVAAATAGNKRTRGLLRRKRQFPGDLLRSNTLCRSYKSG